jgi:hypothetical protein
MQTPTKFLVALAALGTSLGFVAVIDTVNTAGTEEAPTSTTIAGPSIGGLLGGGGDPSGGDERGMSPDDAIGGLLGGGGRYQSSSPSSTDGKDIGGLLGGGGRYQDGGLVGTDGKDIGGLLGGGGAPGSDGAGDSLPNEAIGGLLGGGS